MTNRGGRDAGEFAIHIDADGFMVPFMVAGQQSQFSPRVEGLGAGQSRTVQGTLRIRVGGRASVEAVATVDSCAGEEFMPEHCRVEEANEGNNASEVVRVRLRRAP